MINAIHTTIASLLSLILNIITMIYLISLKKENKNQAASASQKAERNLYIIVVLDFGMDLISATNQVNFLESCKSKFLGLFWTFFKNTFIKLTNLFF